MSFHYGQRVEVYQESTTPHRTPSAWRPGTVNAQGSEAGLRVELDHGGAIWVDPFYIRPLQTDVQFRYVKPDITTTEVPA